MRPLSLKKRLLLHERALIQGALARAGGNHRRAAQSLGISSNALNQKLFRDRRRQPDEAWDDPPLAWLVRWNGNRFEMGACWTREEIAAAVTDTTTIAVLREEMHAKRTITDANTAIAIRPLKASALAVV